MSTQTTLSGIEVEYPFSLLDQRIQVLLNSYRITKPTEIQKKAIPLILEGKNVLITSPTGSGKTEAAFLPIFSQMLKNGNKTLELLYITPLKALTRDINQRINRYTRPLRLLVRPLFGDVDKSFKKPVPNMVVITPESLEIILDYSPRWWLSFKDIRYVIVDEVHELISSKRGYQLLILLERLKSLTKRPLQRIGISATIGDLSKVAELLGGSDGELEIAESEEYRNYNFKTIIALPQDEKEKEDPFIAGVRKINEILKNKKTLIFANSRYSVERIQYVLNDLGYKDIFVHHGSIEKEEREYIESSFKNGKLRGVVATKSLELGIDIGDIEQVIQYRSPGSISTLLQRAGRSGHKPGEEANCFIVTSELEDAIEAIAICKLAQEGKLENLRIIKEPIDVLAKEIIAFALSTTKKASPFTIEEIYKIITSSSLFKELSYEKFLKIVEILSENNLIKVEDNSIIGVGGNFYNLWPFSPEDKGSRSIVNFFSMIKFKETFGVFEGYRKIGELDENFVYRNLRSGTNIRLSGENWKVIEINEKERKILVSRTEEEGAIPLWRGEGIIKPRIVAQEMLRILKNKDFGDIPDANTRYLLEEYINNLDELPSDDLIIIEVTYEKERGFSYYFLTFFGEKINRTLAAVIAEKMAEYTLIVSYHITPYGFCITSRYLDPIEILNEIPEKELEKILNRFIEEYSPYHRALEREIRYHLGINNYKTKGINLAREEAIRQTKELFFDLKNTLKIIRKIKNKDIKLKIIEKEKPSLLAESITSYPQEKPMIRNLKFFIDTLINKGIKTLEEFEAITLENQENIKKQIKQIAKERFILAKLNYNKNGRTLAKLAGVWSYLPLPLTIEYFIADSLDELDKQIKRKDWYDEENIKKFEGKEVVISVTKHGQEKWRPFKRKIDKTLDIWLEIQKEEIEKDSKLVDIKVHITGTPLTIQYFKTPSKYFNMIILNILNSIVKVLADIKRDKRQLLLELP